MWRQQAYPEGTRYADSESRYKADVAPEVKGRTGVIPIPQLPEIIKRQSDNQLQRSSDEQGIYKGFYRMMSQPGKQYIN